MDLEQALRRDLADAVRARVSDQLLNGDPTVANQSGDVTGFYKRLAAPADPAAVADYAAYAGVHALAVDGIHAIMEAEVSSVVPVGVYQHVAAVYQAGSGESGSEAMKRRSAGCVASSFATARPTPAVSAKARSCTRAWTPCAATRLRRCGRRLK